MDGATEEWTTKEGAEAAIAYCKEEMTFYANTFNENHRQWKRWQRISIIFGVIGTIAATIQISSAVAVPYVGTIAPQWLVLLRALPIAIASIATGMLGSFAYQADAVRQGITSDLLTGELARFLAHAAPYEKSKGEARVSDFMDNVRSIIGTEQAGWEATVTSQAQKKNKEAKA